MTRHFSNWFKGYAEFTQYSESPDLFHFWTGVATVAGALRRQVWIDQRYFQWTPNFYVILVGPPGIAAKSTSARMGMQLLAKVPGVKFGPQSISWQGLLKDFMQAEQLVPFGEGEGADAAYLTMSCLTCSVSELGTFFRPDNQDLTDVLVAMWDGQQEVFKRALATSEGYIVTNPWLNVIGCTTPSWLQQNFTEGMIGGGLVSRVVFVYADKKRSLVAYPSDLIPKDLFTDIEVQLVEDLCQIGEIKGEYKLNDDARRYGVQWYEQHWSSRPIDMASERYGGYLARKQTHIHKLAMVLAAAHRNELIITQPDLEGANKMITALEASMKKVFESIGVSDNHKSLVEILAYVQAYGKINKKELYRNLHSIMTIQQFDEASNAGVLAERLKIVQIGNELFYVDPKQWKGV